MLYTKCVFLYFLPYSLTSHTLFVSVLKCKPLCSFYPSDDQLGPNIISTTTAIIRVPISPLVQSLILSKQSLMALIHH